MDKRQVDLERLLRAARGDDGEVEMPYGFDTRVVALSRASQPARSSDVRFVARMFRRIALGAVIVAASAAAATYWQMQENDELAEPSWNAYAIVDTAINTELFE